MHRTVKQFLSSEEYTVAGWLLKKSRIHGTFELVVSSLYVLPLHYPQSELNALESETWALGCSVCKKESPKKNPVVLM
jgi:hypothetical protein